MSFICNVIPVVFIFVIVFLNYYKYFRLENVVQFCSNEYGKNNVMLRKRYSRVYYAHA